ncbi:MAG: hypothetical protein M1815_004183 [Lichina confinis]|nr:MAG: hypothetical protein M1815_004183 [Lichina confinis]
MLLARGAHTNYTTHSTTLLHWTALYSDTQTLAILRETNISDIDIVAKNLYKNTAMDNFLIPRRACRCIDFLHAYLRLESSVYGKWWGTYLKYFRGAYPWLSQRIVQNIPDHPLSAELSGNDGDHEEDACDSGEDEDSQDGSEREDGWETAHEDDDNSDDDDDDDDDDGGGGNDDEAPKAERHSRGPMREATTKRNETGPTMNPNMRPFQSTATIFNKP